MNETKDINKIDRNILKKYPHTIIKIKIIDDELLIKKQLISYINEIKQTFIECSSKKKIKKYCKVLSFKKIPMLGYIAVIVCNFKIGLKDKLILCNSIDSINIKIDSVHYKEVPTKNLYSGQIGTILISIKNKDKLYKFIKNKNLFITKKKYKFNTLNRIQLYSNINSYQCNIVSPINAISCIIKNNNILLNNTYKIVDNIWVYNSNTCFKV